jgi:CheY-like chemotaxis protein
MSKLFEGKKILWVEDDIFLGGLIGQRLGELGATLFGANDGSNAIALAKKEKPDLILLELAMHVSHQSPI